MADIAPTMPIVEAVEHLLRKAQDGGHTWPVLLLGSDAWAQWSEVLDKADTVAPGVGALRLRLVATKGRDESMTLRGEDGKYASDVLLDLDYWALIPQ